MESTYAKIEDNVVVSVEVVTDMFVKSNSNRYDGFLKVGEGSKRAYCGKGYLYLPDKDKIVAPKPFGSWILSEKYEWQAPVLKPDGDYIWSEKSLSWIENKI